MIDKTLKDEEHIYAWKKGVKFVLKEKYQVRQFQAIL